MENEGKQFVKWLIILIVSFVLSVIAVILTVFLPTKDSAAAPSEIMVKPSLNTTITDAPKVEDSYTLVATVMPENAENRALNWSAEFENPDSGWAKGKAVSKYISLSLNADTTECTVKCLQPFGDTVIVTATSIKSPEVKATCRCEYLQRSGVMGNCSISFGYSDMTFDMSIAQNKWTSTVLGTIYDPKNPTNNQMSAGELCFSCEINASDVSTMPDSFEYTYTFEATDEYKAKMQSKGYTFSKVTGMLENGSIVTDIPENFAFGCYFPLMGLNGLSDRLEDMDFIMEIDSTMNQVIGTMGSTPFMTLTITAKGSVSTYTQTTKFVRG